MIPRRVVLGVKHLDVLLAYFADDGVVPAEEDVLPVLPQESRPSIEEYRAKWERLLAQHSKPVEGEYSIGNLVPKPIHQLWQDCPYVPFELLILEEVVFSSTHKRHTHNFVNKR